MFSYILIAIAAVVSGFAQSIAGFGAGMILMMVLPNIVGLVQAPGLTTAICLTLAITLLVKYRKSIIYNHAISFSVAYILSSAIVISFINDIDLFYLTILFGVFLIVFAVRNLFFKTTVKINHTIPMAFVFGLIGGICSGFFAMGGPLWAIYFMSLTDKREEYMGSTQACIVFTGILETIMRSINGLFAINMIPLAVIGIIFINVGKKIGIAFAGKIDNQKVGMLIYSLVGICGVVTIIKQFV